MRSVPIRLACAAFMVSESCYRYEPKLDAENTLIADWLIRLADNHRNWGFGLCYLYLRNVKSFGWNAWCNLLANGPGWRRKALEGLEALNARYPDIDTQALWTAV